ncbi:MAG: hypothetical protein NC120_05470 [Ruminococcus sp.]|nr:hypothetical protein [Ruminococcus sp.]
MIDRERIKSAFESISPSEELVGSVLAAGSRRTAAGTVRKRKLPAAFTAAAAGLLLAAGLGAAVSGTIDFKSVFGGYVRVADDTLANSLMGQVSNVRYKVSDDDYMITVTGVTGTKNTLMAIAEISRKDGSPVTDSFVNKPQSDHLMEFEMRFDISGFEAYGSAGGSYGAFVNEKGNIGISLNISSERALSGRTITMEGVNFYPGELYRSFLDKNQIARHTAKNRRGYVHWSNGNEPVDISDENVMGLPLEWALSFKYTASDKALAVKKYVTSDKDGAENVRFYRSVSPVSTGTDGISRLEDSFGYESVCTVREIEISAADIILNVSYPLSEYEFSPEYSVMKSDVNEAYLIRADGGHIPLAVSGLSGQSDEETVYCQIRLECREEQDHTPKFIDVDCIESICINGTVFPVE